MRGLSDAPVTSAVHDDGMNAGHPAHAGWEDEVRKLMLLGRDREAAELAARSMQHVTTTPIRGGIPMGPLEQLDELEPILGKVASGIATADLDSPTPCDNFTVRGVLGHMIGGATQFAAAFRGEIPPDVGADVAEGDDVVARAGNALAGLMEAIRAPGALDRTVASPFGELPGDAFARFVVLDGLVHGWDLAIATGQTYEPPDALVADVEAFARQAIAPAMRDGDTFAEAVDPPTGATPIERLVAFTGRKIA
jgi:uncharacterized protein (TIGR03086 family)